MNALTGHHPSYHQLAAYHFEALDAGEMVKIEDHLQGCALCRNFLKRADRDDLVHFFEHPSAAGSTKSPAMETLPIPPDTRTGVPEELRDHPRYEIIKLLGEGGMGMVFRARHKRMNRDVAIKIIHSRHVQSEMAVKRFHQEIESLSQLQHPNISQAFDADQIGNVHFFVMEYIEGTDLSKIIQKKGALPVREACILIKQVAEALEHADEKKMIHRDLKPANLIVTTGGTVKVLDFGLARITTEQPKSGLTSDGTVMGTPEYMAPEQGRNSKNVDIRSDLYSVGVTLYQMLAGRLPFRGTAIECLLAHQNEPPPPLTDFRADLPTELVRVVERLMEKDPRKRYQKPSELVKDLLPFTQKPKPASPGGAKKAPLPKPTPVTNVLPDTGELDQKQERESIIKGERAAAIADDEDIAFDWAAPARPKQKATPRAAERGSTPKPPASKTPPPPIPKPAGREIAPLPEYAEEFEPPPSGGRRRSAGVFAEEFKKGDGASTLTRIKEQEEAATKRMILILVLLTLLGGAILYVVLVLLPNSRTKPKTTLAPGGHPPAVRVARSHDDHAPPRLERGPDQIDMTPASV